MNQKTEKALNEQIKKEEYSSRLYLAMASWCEANGFPGAAVFLYEHAEEERMHMLKMIHFVNDRGAHAKLLDIEAPQLDYNSLLEIFTEILVHEQYITESINNLYQVAVDEKDYTAGYKGLDNLESEKVLGNEKVSGYKCVKKEVVTSFKAMGNSMKIRLIVWESDKFEMPLRTMDEDGAIRK